MNDQTKKFIEKQEQDENVLGIILFGSWARGNNRPDSDVDLVIILEEGFKRTVEEHDGQIFEIIYTTAKSAFDFWENNKDDAANLWEVAQIVFDRKGDVEKLKGEAEEMIAKGKKEIDKFQKGQFRFDSEDQIHYAEEIYKTDKTTANLILMNKVFSLTELFFDLQQLWTPAPKQRLDKIKELNPKLYELLENFYLDDTSFEEKVSIAKEIVLVVFGD